ncbi:MAG: family 16 glycosylhydrolase [Flavobacteriaceae bacterium]
MKNYYLKLITLLLLFSQFTFAQQMPIDFSDNSDNFNVWGGSTFAKVSSPTESNNFVGEFFRSSSTSEQGQYIDLIRPIDLDFDDEITLMFYASDNNSHTIIVKLENGENPNIEVGVTTSSQNIWTELTFDFSTVGGNGKYDRLTIRIDDGSSVPGAFLIDDIHDGSVPTDPNALDVIYTDLVWADEFNTSGKIAINSTNWFHQTQLPAGGNWFNQEEQHYTNRIENSFVENGNLNIVAIKESFTDQGETKQYTSARLNSKFAFTYGRVDVRAKLPIGNGTWPAIWTLGKNVNETGAYWQTQGFGTTSWPACGEIDIMEHGLGAVNYTSSAIHTPSSYGNTVNVASQLISDVAANWHIYSMNWSPNQITFLVDDVAFYTYNPSVKNASTWPFDLEQYLILNVAMGGIAAGIDGIDPSFTQSPMIIDYVRVYQNNSLSTDEFKDDIFKVFPNPTDSEINIKSKVRIDRVELYDILGNFILGESKTTNSIEVNNLQTGLYLLNIYSGGSKTVKKIVIN